MIAIYVEAIFVVGIALASIVYLLVMMTTNRLPVLVVGKGPKTSMATNTRELAGENNSNFL